MPSVSIPSKKAPKGTVVVESFKGRLRLRFRVAGDRYCLAVGLPDLPENREIARAKADWVAQDIKIGQFDPTLAKYQTSERAKATRQQPMLDILWDKYTEFRNKQIATPSTLKNYNRFHKSVHGTDDFGADSKESFPSHSSINWTPSKTRRLLAGIIESTSLIDDCQTFRNYIAELPSKHVGNAIEIHRYICKTQPPGLANYILAQIKICCEWATKSGLLSCNPFNHLGDCEGLPPNSNFEP
jgi:integrase